MHPSAQRVDGPAPTACRILRVADRNRARMRVLAPLPRDPVFSISLSDDATLLSPQSVRHRAVLEAFAALGGLEPALGIVITALPGGLAWTSDGMLRAK